MGALHQITERNPDAVVKVFGQELNDETWAIAQSDLMMQDIDPNQMANGNSLTADAFPTRQFDFILANPPYGVDWKGYAAPIKDEHETLGSLRPVRRRAAACLGRVVAVPAAHAVEDEADAGRGSASCSRARRCSPGRPGRGSRRSAAGSSRTTGSRASSRCRTRCSTTPASPPTSGS